ncbi:hypothetical protein HUU39_14045 [candidate division KSB1 bacterium]|nr:hypothetical protein [bacterium]NUM66387.1 hypothetical protein [candidate division KSB1 bacterium]
MANAYIARARQEIDERFIFGPSRDPGDGEISRRTVRQLTAAPTQIASARRLIPFSAAKTNA